MSLWVAEVNQANWTREPIKVKHYEMPQGKHAMLQGTTEMPPGRHTSTYIAQTFFLGSAGFLAVYLIW